MTNRRIEYVKDEMQSRKLDAILITSYENYRYFSGFTGSNCALLITRGEYFAVTDGRYDVQIKKQAPFFTPIVTKRSKNEQIAELLLNNSIKSVGYETSCMTDLDACELKKLCATSEWVPLPDFGESVRSVKEECEILFIRNAAKIADSALSSFAGALHPGITERECAALLNYHMALNKSERPAFETIAASGVRGSMPHAEPTDEPLCQNGLLTLDFGACVGGYMSDITRTLHLGNPCRELCELWDMVYNVHQKCIAKAAPGITCRELSEYQCELFAEYGMDKYVMHSLGHGVGLAIHEAPNVSSRSSATLCENMVITIEPGLYVENLGGVRIEDTVLITSSGAESLTLSPHRYNINLG